MDPRTHRKSGPSRHGHRAAPSRTELRSLRRRVDLKLAISVIAAVHILGVLIHVSGHWFATSTSHWLILAAAFLVPIVSGPLLWLFNRLQPRVRTPRSSLVVIAVLLVTIVLALLAPLTIDPPLAMDLCSWRHADWHDRVSGAMHRIPNWAALWGYVPIYGGALVLEWCRGDGRDWLWRWRAGRH